MRTRAWSVAALLCVTGLYPALAAQPDAPVSVWRALVIGFERYPGLPDGKGVAEGARDLADVLGRQGVKDLTRITAPAIDRVQLLKTIDALAERTQNGDTILLAFGGRGGLAPSGDPEPYLALPGKVDAAHELSASDVRVFVAEIERRGARAIIVADASFGTQGVRQHTAWGEGGRDQPGAAMASAPQTFGAGANTPLRSLILSASDLRYANSAVPIPGVAEPRPALTYAVARGLEGRADFDQDGQISASELVAYVARLVYQLSDQRQKVAAVLPAELAMAQNTRRNRERGIVLSAGDSLGELPDTSVKLSADPPVLAAAPVAIADIGPADAPIRLAAATGDAKQLAALTPAESAFEAVSRVAEPDLIWDATNRDVITGDGDLVAQAVALTELGGVVDRTTALRRIKRLMIAAPQQAAVLPNDDVQKRGNVVKINIGNALGRALILFNITGDGVVRFLYPQPNDPPIIMAPDFTLSLAVNEPLGADQLVAVTAPQRLSALERGLRDMNNLKTPVAAVDLVRKALTPGVLVGSVGVFSGEP